MIAEDDDDALPARRATLRVIAATGLETEKMSWMGQANCNPRQADLFTSGEGGSSGYEWTRWGAAVLLCDECPVWAACLAWAELYDVRGVAGGMTPDQRRIARRLSA